MNKYPKISIIIPSYNKAKYIGETLKSIVSQNYPNLEVIIQDGRSTDGTLDVIKKYTKSHPKIFSWESKIDKGQTDAVYKGFKKATGDIYTYINADDVYEIGALKIVGNYFSKNPKTLWLAGKGRVINEQGDEIANLVTAYKNVLLHVNNYSVLLMVNYLMQPSVFLSCESYKKYGPFIGKKSYVLEYDLWLKLGKHKMPEVINNNLTKFRLYEQNKSMMNKAILVDDLSLAKKHTNNSLIIFLHQLNNLGRRFIATNI